MEIPTSSESGLPDWDCPAAIDWDRFVHALRELKRTGVLDGVDSFEDLVQFDKGSGGVEEGVVEGCRGRVVSELGFGDGEAGEGGGLALVEGFLMFVEERVMEVLDVKIFLRGRHEIVRRRREGRSGYDTIEGLFSFFLSSFHRIGRSFVDGGLFSRGMVGYWKDPPGYWDKIVWPNYVSLIIFH